jgi:hypothetical protein
MIFVSIAAYKDRDLLNTIESIYDNADNPKDIRTVVLNQIDMELYTDYTTSNEYVETFYVDHEISRGVCWARALIQSMIRDEDYYMQIDAHMRFEKGWDSKMIYYLKKCNSNKSIISFYPPPIHNEILIRQIQINIIRGIGSGAVSSIGLVLNKNMCDIYDGKDMPMKSLTTAAGFIFAPIKFIQEVPIDPKLFWNYEETDITLRAYTHGWDFFSFPEPLIWHRYNTTGEMIHIKESKYWLPLENESNVHAPSKYYDKEYVYPEKYMLGKERTIESFNILNNLSLQTKEKFEKNKKKMLVVVPHRDREEHLKKYLEVVPKYFSDNNIECDILLCELDEGCDWNAGLSVNSCINFIKKDDYEFIYIHHVDIYPIGEWQWPNENEFITDLGDVGSCLLRVKDFLQVGGYGNNFWGWGGEDDNLYMKLHSIGLLRVVSTTEYDTAFQSHERKFNGINYSNNLREISKPADTLSIFCVNKVSTTYGLEKVSDNIYKQKVKSLIQKQDKKKVIIGYINNVDTFSDVAPWVKSAIYHATDADVWLITTNDKLHSELKAFGAKPYLYEPKDDYLFLDRWIAFKELLTDFPYEEILHADVTDSYFQKNPFDGLSGGLIGPEEGITIGECSWNTGMLNNIYGYSFPDKQVICCGVVYGDYHNFMCLIDKMQEEFKMYPHARQLRGSDQPMLIKFMYKDEIPYKAYSLETLFAANLHHKLLTPTYSGDIHIDKLSVTDSNNQKYAIVHQYNRSEEMNKRVKDFFNNYFSTDQKR